jgi:hypothetical protein
MVTIGAIVSRWTRPLVIIGILAIHKFIGYIHEFRYSSRLEAPHLFIELWETEPRVKSVDCHLVRNIFY